MAYYHKGLSHKGTTSSAPSGQHHPGQHHPGQHHPYPALNPEQMKMYNSMGATEEQLDKANQQAMKDIDEKQRKLGTSVRGQIRDGKKVLRLLLLGKTGAGKSATGNLIIGEKRFEESLQSVSCTGTIQLEECDIDGTRIMVIDTPGFNDTAASAEDILTEMAKVVDFFKEGIHGVLFMFNIGNPRFTEEEKQSFEQIQKGLLGDGFIDNCFVVITHGNKIVEEHSLLTYLQNESRERTEFGNLLNGILEKRVIAVDNSEPTEYGRQRQREQVVRMVAALSNATASPKIFKQFLRNQKDVAEKVPETCRQYVPDVERMVADQLVSMPRNSILNISRLDRDNMISSIVDELQQKLDASQAARERETSQLREELKLARAARQQDAAATAKIVYDAVSERVTGKENMEGVGGFMAPLLKAAGQGLKKIWGGVKSFFGF